MEVTLCTSCFVRQVRYVLFVGLLSEELPAILVPMAAKKSKLVTLAEIRREARRVWPKVKVREQHYFSWEISVEDRPPSSYMIAVNRDRATARRMALAAVKTL